MGTQGVARCERSRVQAHGDATRARPRDPQQLRLILRDGDSGPHNPGASANAGQGRRFVLEVQERGRIPAPELCHTFAN